MAKIIVAGDWHGSRTQAQYIYDQAIRLQATHIIQVGDFGYWPHRPKCIPFLETCNKLARKNGIELWWLDGNHENHDALDVMTGGDNSQMHVTSRITDKGNKVEYPHIKYLPRGYRFEIDGVSFMSYGGAYSIDRKWRVKHDSWWPQEIIDHEHVMEIEPIHCDVLLSHDVPTGYRFPYNEFSTESMISKNDRDNLYILAQKITPYVCIGGHHHMYAQYKIKHNAGYAMCYITNCDGFGHQSYYLLDTDIVKEWGNINAGVDDIK